MANDVGKSKFRFSVFIEKEFTNKKRNPKRN